MIERLSALMPTAASRHLHYVVKRGVVRNHNAAGADHTRPFSGATFDSMDRGLQATGARAISPTRSQVVLWPLNGARPKGLD